MAESNLAPLETSLECPRKELSACSWSATTSTHKPCHKAVELAQLRKFGPEGLGLVVAFAGRDDTASLCHSQHLTQRIPRVADVDQNLVTESDVESLVGEGELIDTALLEVGVLDASRFSDSACPCQDAGIDVDPGDMAVRDELSETDRNGA